MNQMLTEHHIAQCITYLKIKQLTKPSMLDNLEILQLYLFLICFVKKKNQFISNMEDNTKLQPEELNITFAELNQTVN